MPSPPRVLVVSADTIGANMAGSGIRYWNVARVLAQRQPVTLAVPGETDLGSPDGLRIVSYPTSSPDESGRRIAGLLESHDVIVSQLPPYQYLTPDLLAPRFVVIDLYAPWFLEKLEFARIDPILGNQNRSDDLDILRRLLAMGDFYICASERQRDYWLGALTAAGRLNPEQLDRNLELRSLIDVAPMGIPESRPIPNGPGPRDLFDSIEPDDPVLLWNGGIWNWLDPLSAIHATSLLVEAGHTPRLVFMGVESPSHQVAEMEMIRLARELANRLNLTGTHVFFNDWVEFDHRQNWMLQANLTLSLHQPTIESRYAYRTRVLDNLWCRVPIVATEGDVLADVVVENELGRVVPPGNPRAVADAISTLIDPKVSRAYRRRIATVAKRYTWEASTAPLVQFCLDPWKNDPGKSESRYIHRLENIYTSTAEYARSLEQRVSKLESQRPATEAADDAINDPWKRRWKIWRRNL